MGKCGPIPKNKCTNINDKIVEIENVGFSAGNATQSVDSSLFFIDERDFSYFVTKQKKD